MSTDTFFEVFRNTSNEIVIRQVRLLNEDYDAKDIQRNLWCEDVINFSTKEAKRLMIEIGEVVEEIEEDVKNLRGGQR